MGRLAPGHSIAQVALAAALVVLPVGSVVLALDAPATSGGTNPATTQPATAPANPPKSSDESKADKPERKPGPNGQFVQKGDLNLEVRADGQFMPTDTWELRPVFKAYGGSMQITSIAAPGARVKKGDTVLECDPTGFKWAITQAETDVAGAKAGLEKAASDVALGTIGDEMNLKAAQDGVKQAEDGKKWFDEVDGPHMLKQADLVVKAAQDSHDDQNDELEQLRKMYKDEELTSATSEIVVRRAVRAFDQSKISLKMQQERREKVKQFDYPITKQRVLDAIDGAKQQLSLTKAQQAAVSVNRQGALVAAKIGLEQSNKKLADLREDEKWFSVKAPSDGVVSYGTLVEGQWIGADPRSLKPGERISSGQTVMRVVSPGKMKVVLSVPESQAFWLEPGMKAKITPSSLPLTTYEAKCPAVELVPHGNPPTPAFQLTLEPGDVDTRLQPGMRASVVIDAGKREGVLLVPVAAVSGGKVKVRDKDGSVSEKSVTLGKTDGSQVEVRDGLKEGDEIVLPKK